MRGFFSRTVLVWFLLVFVAVANGGLRTAVLNPTLGEGAGHVVSTLLLCLLLFLVTWALIGWIRPRLTQETFWMGLLWVGMTISFEFLAGHYLFGNSWEKLLADYDLASGRVWVLVLIVTFGAPFLAARARGLFSNEGNQ